jgi:hypothetical protein
MVSLMGNATGPSGEQAFAEAIATDADTARMQMEDLTSPGIVMYWAYRMHLFLVKRSWRAYERYVSQQA